MCNEAELQTWSFRVDPDGALADPKLFVEDGGEGLAVDSGGRVYVAAGQIRVYDPTGKRIATACGNGNIGVFEVGIKGEPSFLPTEEASLRHIVWSADGMRIADWVLGDGPPCLRARSTGWPCGWVNWFAK